MKRYKPVNMFQNLQTLHTKRLFKNILSGWYLINSGSTNSIKRNIGFWMTCYKRPSLSSVWSECMKGGVTVSLHHILTDRHSASTKITESHSASILTPTQPQSNLLSPPYQARLGLLDTTPNHTWHLGNVSFFHCVHDPKCTNCRLPHYVIACLIFEK